MTEYNFTKLKFTNREEYLEYRKQWKAEYAELSQKLRELKNDRAEHQRVSQLNPKVLREQAYSGGPMKDAYNKNWNICTDLDRAKYNAGYMIGWLKAAKEKAAKQRDEAYYATTC